MSEENQTHPTEEDPTPVARVEDETTVTSTREAEMEAHGPDHAHGDDHHGISHIMPMPVLFMVFLALIVFTVLTVIFAGGELWYPTPGGIEVVELPPIYFGVPDLYIALTIATVKAGLVGAYFMHMRYDKPLNVMFFLGCLIFVALFVGLTLVDVDSYNNEIQSFNLQQTPAATPAPATQPQ
ncbi:Hypothetical protein PBC10988_37570 [Planctomycetales bacterium 10988]|nr:Hypothetical protein PBC10988_37570 [Planctomycetales bacterium 10988]